jgi:hypothetical protein
MIHVASMLFVRHPLILQLAAVPLDGLVIHILNVSNLNVKLTRTVPLIKPVKTMSVSTLASVPFVEPELFVKWTSTHLFVFVHQVYKEIL